MVSLLAVGGATAAAAQQSPAEVATAFFKAVAEERWSDAARHLDVAALDRYRRERIAAERLPQSRQRGPVLTVEELLRHDPDMPPAVAEYQVRKANEASREVFDWVAYEFAGVSGIDALAALSAEESAARWLQARDLRWAARQALERERARGCPVPPEAERAMPTPTYRILATAIVDSSSAYILHDDGLRHRPDPDVDAAMYEDAPRVLLLRRRSGRWLILPRQGMLYGMVGVISSVDCPAPARLPP